MMEVDGRAEAAWHWKRDADEVEESSADASGREAFELDAERAVGAGRPDQRHPEERLRGAVGAVVEREVQGNHWEGVEHATDWPLRYGWRASSPEVRLFP